MQAGSTGDGATAVRRARGPVVGLASGVLLLDPVVARAHVWSRRVRVALRWVRTAGTLGHMPTPDLPDRWRGALLGTALGDGVGAPFEGHRHVMRDEVARWMDADEPLTWTDDTAMAIGLARSLIACDGRVDPGHLGDTFAAAYRAEPWRGYGAGPPQVFAAAARGVSYVEAAAAMFDGSGSYGNGAAMRAPPAAVVGHPELSAVADLARAQALVTHAHPLGQDGAVLLAVAVAIVAGTAREPAGRDATPDAVEDVAIGGDTDTIAAMAGALVGARVGAGGLPDGLLARLEGRDVMVLLADDLEAVVAT